AGEASVTQVGLAVGFAETSSFTTAFRRHTGVTPTAFRRGLEELRAAHRTCLKNDDAASCDAASFRVWTVLGRPQPSAVAPVTRRIDGALGGLRIRTSVAASARDLPVVRIVEGVVGRLLVIGEGGRQSGEDADHGDRRQEHPAYRTPGRGETYFHG